MFIDALRPESTSGRICEASFLVGLTNSAGREPMGPVSINIQPLAGLERGWKCSLSINSH